LFRYAFRSPVLTHGKPGEVPLKGPPPAGRRHFQLRLPEVHDQAGPVMHGEQMEASLFPDEATFFRKDHRPGRLQHRIPQGRGFRSAAAYEERFKPANLGRRRTIGSRGGAAGVQRAQGLQQELGKIRIRHDRPEDAITNP